MFDRGKDLERKNWEKELWWILDRSGASGVRTKLTTAWQKLQLNVFICYSITRIMKDSFRIESITYEKGCVVVKTRETISNGTCHHMTIPMDLSKMRNDDESDAPAK